MLSRRVVPNPVLLTSVMVAGLLLFAVDSISAEQPAAARPHAVPRDREPGLLDGFQAVQRGQGPQPVDREAQERADRASRIFVRLVHRDVGARMRERYRARRPGHAAARYHDPHLSLRITRIDIH